MTYRVECCGMKEKLIQVPREDKAFLLDRRGRAEPFIDHPQAIFILIREINNDFFTSMAMHGRDIIELMDECKYNSKTREVVMIALFSLETEKIKQEKEKIYFADLTGQVFELAQKFHITASEFTKYLGKRLRNRYERIHLGPAPWESR